MNSLIKVWMNKQGLHDIDPNVVVLDVQESEAKVSVSTSANVKSDGMHITNTARESLQVQITVEVHEYSMERRARLMERIQAWATSGSLTVGYRPGQRLECVCTTPPALGSAWKWTSAVNITYTAYVIPYWISDELQHASIDNPTTSGSVGIRPIGTAKQTPLMFTLRNAGSGTLNSVNVRSGSTDTLIQLRNMGLSTNGTAELGYDSLGYLYIKTGDGTSLLNKRTAASSDDLLVLQQQGNTISVSSDQPTTYLFSTRGRWL